MKNKNTNDVLKTVLSITVLNLLGICTVIFTILYTENTGIVILAENKRIISICIVVISALSVVIAYVFQITDKNLPFKLVLTFLICASVLSLSLYLIKILKIEDKIGSVSALREFVSSYGHFTVPAFIIIQFLQVVALPIPSIVTIGAGVALFGFWGGVVYSFVGIFTASITAFFIGRKFGYKFVGWLIGRKNLDKGLGLIKGKDKLTLTIMFLFPFFPDDLLCFVAGITKINALYFCVMITCTRCISIVMTAMIVSGKVLAFKSVWVIVILLIFLLITVIIYLRTYKNGVKIKANGKNDSAYRFK